MKWWLLRLLLLVLLGTAGALGWRQYREFRKNRLVDRAQSMIEQKDYTQAMVSVRRALALNPRDVGVIRMMVGLTRSAKTKEELFWHRVLSDREPGVSANDLAWADCALRFSERLIAEQALSRVDEAGRSTAAFHNATGRLAEMSGRFPQAEAHLAEAAKMEPENVAYQIHLGIVRLLAGEPAQMEEARQILQKHLSDPALRNIIARALLNDLFRQQDWRKALDLAKQVQAAPDATFGERMIYLGLLRRFQRPEFHGYLSTLQEMAASNAEHAATLITWMADNTLVMVAVSWAKTLPESVATKAPMPTALGECYALLQDWESLKALVADANWENAEFLRLAFLARVQREEGDLAPSRNSWLGAVKAAGNRPGELAFLIAHATKWGWESETQDVLWTMARGNTDQLPAINALYQIYNASGNTHGLLNVSTRRLEIDPKDPVALNNVVALSLLLNTNVERALSLADEAYRLQPQNPGIISTYAYSLHVRGQTANGIALMRTLDEKWLRNPNFAAYFATMLAESETPEEAAKYVEIAQTGKLLPEEMALVRTAHEILLRKKTDRAPQ